MHIGITIAVGSAATGEAGTAAFAEDTDTISASGIVGNYGTIVSTEGADTMVAGGGAFPGDVSSVRVLLQPQDIVQSSNVITSWPDRSGNSNNGTPSGSPAYVPSYLDGYAAAGLTAGSSQYFSLPNSFSAFTAGEVFIVVRSDTTGNNATLWNFSGAGENSQELFPWSDTHVYEKFGTAVRKDAGTPTLAVTSNRLYNVRSAAGAYSTFLNTVQQFTTATNAVSFGTHPAIGGGAGQDAAPSTFFTGRIVEFILCNSVLSSGDRSKIANYFKAKYPSLGL